MVMCVVDVCWMLLFCVGCCVVCGGGCVIECGGYCCLFFVGELVEK